MRTNFATVSQCDELIVCRRSDYGSLPSEMVTSST